ncbi:MAG: response regulator transcription factor [Ignavibacteriales bacterium]|nr:response regulator transcription factor [Ignavibacteriales bacterium]
MDIKIAIVEDDKNIRESYKLLFEVSPGFKCLALCETAEEALKKIPGLDVDVVLMDINLPGKSGIACTYQLKEKMPKVQIVMQTVYDDSNSIFASLKAGASGYLLKRTPPAKILEAIEDVIKGGSPMSSQIARMVVESFKKTSNDESLNSLSLRENELLGLLAQGFRYKEIAEKMFISMDTVRSHIRRVYEKLQVNSRTEAVLKYLKQ